MAIDTLQTRFARLLAEYTSSQQLLKQRLSRIEHHNTQKHSYTSEEDTPTEVIDPAFGVKKTAALLNVPSR